ncbi:MAG: hypothetical protein EAZ97_13710, partial [Bacteroidetes bacterium]
MSNQAIKNDHFPVSGYVWHEVSKKLNNFKIRKLLGNHLNISDYSPDIKQYWARLLVLLPNSPMENQPRYFSKKTGILHHHYALDWEIIRD